MEEQARGRGDISLSMKEWKDDGSVGTKTAHRNVLPGSRPIWRMGIERRTNSTFIFRARTVVFDCAIFKHLRGSG
jgi:hypothetical protein